ncbi:MFS general substrate transporter [Abortiporus biennis]|nr:MFS general substrate transporter [Abortiporus biennis]
MPLYRRWLIVIVISISALLVTCTSSIASFAQEGISRDFHVGKEVSILGISLYVQGLSFGPLLVGPLSEIYGRNIIYRGSFLIFFAFNFAVAFAPNIVVYLVFRFLTGFCGAAFMSVAGGSVSDLFHSHQVANPMAVYTISPFIGPVLGPLLSGFINQYADWRWTFRVIIIWSFTQLVLLCLLVPETFVPVLEAWKADRLRQETGIEKFFAPLEKSSLSIPRLLMSSCTTPFKLLALEKMALLLNLWTSLLLGILYLAFEAFPIIFGEGHGFNSGMTGLTFLGFGIGMVLALASQPLWNKLYRNESRAYHDRGETVPPELHLRMGQLGALLTPIALYWLAFTTYPSVHWIVPILAAIPYGAGILLCFTSTFTYLVVAYRPVAASAMASNSFVRLTFAAAFPLFAGQMYHGLGTVGATALLAGLTTIATPLPFVFFRIGARLRSQSKFAASS